MFIRKILVTLSISIMVSGLCAKDPAKVRIVDLEDVATEIEKATSSSADGQHDFPVYLYGEKQMKTFDDLYMLLVRHDLEPSDPNRYICVELIDRKDQSSVCEMAKHMRFSGATEDGTFSIKLMEMNTLQVLRKGY